jgi:hypothetical protein
MRNRVPTRCSISRIVVISSEHEVPDETEEESIASSEVSSRRDNDERLEDTNRVKNHPKKPIPPDPFFSSSSSPSPLSLSGFRSAGGESFEVGQAAEVVHSRSRTPCFE